MASLKDLILQLSPEQQHYIARLVASLPESSGGLGLPLKNMASQRAKALGFDYDANLYHGVEGKFKGQAFDPKLLQSRDYGWYGSGVYLTPDPDAASAYANPLMEEKFVGQHVMPVVARKGKIFDFGDAAPVAKENFEEFNTALSNLGYNTVEVPNQYADPQYAKNFETVIRNPKDVRSKFAAFNPWLKKSSNLLASHPAATMMAAGGLSGLANKYLDQPMDMGPDVARVARETGIQPMSRGEALKNAISAVPGIGDALAAAEGLQGAAEGDWTKAGLGALAAAPMMGAIKTYHGSPRAEPFSKFSKEFMGSGEGAQAFSKGHYVAEQPKVAKNYYRPGGSLYEVSLEWPDAAREAADPMSREHFFQWDKPFRKQPENIQKALLDIIEENPPEIQKYKEFLKRNWKIDEPNMVDFVKMYPNILIRDARLEPHLYKKGIPGVAFADQMTRIKPIDQRTYNYAVYGDEIPRIVNRNNSSLLDMLGIKE